MRVRPWSPAIHVPPPTPLLLAVVTLAFVFTAGLIILHGFRRYRDLMVLAEEVAANSTCSACQTYARFRALDEKPQMKVQCRKCGHEWLLG